MRTLLYIPIIHSGADMGSLAAELDRKGVDEFGRDFWNAHVRTVDKYWDIIEQCCQALDSNGIPVKIYQDGMVADGEIASKIMEDSIRAGSRNYQIISRLVNRGAFIMQTEDFALVKKEVDILKEIPTTGMLIVKIFRLLRFKITRSRLIQQRDNFIAGRIAATLGQGETGLIFLGAYHDILSKLPKDIQVMELKEIRKVREYQKLLPFHDRKKQRFDQLARYLVMPEQDFSGKSVNRE